MAKLNINGRVREVQAEPDTPLLWVIREQVGLIGTKYGCGVAQCGACTVHINGDVRRSCAVPLGNLTAKDKIVTTSGPVTVTFGYTIDGLAPTGDAQLALTAPQTREETARLKLAENGDLTIARNRYYQGTWKRKP